MRGPNSAIVKPQSVLNWFIPRLSPAVLLFLALLPGAPPDAAAQTNDHQSPAEEIEAVNDAASYDFGFKDWRLDLGGDFNGEIQSYYSSLTLPVWSKDGSLLFLEGQLFTSFTFKRFFF